MTKPSAAYETPRSSLMSGNSGARLSWKKWLTPCAMATSVMTTVSLLAFKEFLDCRQHPLRLVAERAVAALRQLEQRAVLHPRLGVVELRHRPVFVVLALDRQHRAGDLRQVVVADVPAGEVRVTPDVGPAV